MATKNLGLGDKVRIVNTRDPKLDGSICCVMGFTARYYGNDYVIVMLPSAIWMEPYKSSVTAIQITDSCLELITRGDGTPVEGDTSTVSK